MSWKDSSTSIHGDLTGDVFTGTMRTMPGRGGAGVLPYKSHIGMCRPKGWGLCTVLI